MATRKGQQHYSQQVKQAVLAALLTGQAVEEIAKQYQVNRTTIIRWRKSLGDKVNEIELQKQASIGELLMGYIRESVITLTAQAKFFRDESWLRKQSASDIAILHGVATDKQIRLLEAIERANSQRPAIPESVS